MTVIKLGMIAGAVSSISNSKQTKKQKNKNLFSKIENSLS